MAGVRRHDPDEPLLCACCEARPELERLLEQALDRLERLYEDESPVFEASDRWLTGACDDVREALRLVREGQ